MTHMDAAEGELVLDDKKQSDPSLMNPPLNLPTYHFNLKHFDPFFPLFYEQTQVLTLIGGSCIVERSFNDKMKGSASLMISNIRIHLKPE